MTKHWTLFQTALGWSAAVWSGDLLHRLTIGHASPQAAAEPLAGIVGDPSPRDRFIAEGIDRLQRFTEGELDVTFDSIALDLGWATPFQREVTGACRQIVCGETIRYGELATRAGYPGAARAVGSVMAKNRFPLIVPCHRVVSAQSLGGYSAPDGLRVKVRLLTAEAAFRAGERPQIRCARRQLAAQA